MVSFCSSFVFCSSKWRTDLVRPVKEVDIVEGLDEEGVEEEAGDVEGVEEGVDPKTKTRNGLL